MILFRKSFPDIIADWYFSGPCGNLNYLGHSKKYAWFCLILHNIGRAHFLSEEGGTGIIYIGYIIQRRDGYPGTRFITRSGTRVKKYPEIRALIMSNMTSCQTCMIVGRVKALNNCIIGQTVRPCRGAGDSTKKWKFSNFGKPRSTPCTDDANFAWPSEPTVPSAVQNFRWIGATSRPCWVKMLIFGLWVETIPAVCRFAASCR